MAVTTNYNSAVGTDATKATPPQQDQTVGVQIVGAFTGSFTPEATIDGVIYNPIEAFPQAGGASVVVFTAPGSWRIRGAGTNGIRVRATALSAGTPAVTLNPSQDYA
jgi:hypothetical protein